MPYMDYSLPFQRTGFRPYGMTNPWSATQLSGIAMRHAFPFSEEGGWALGQIQRGFSPRFLHGLGQAPTICLDQNENTISCTDPNCTYGDCGSSGSQITVGALCLDQGQNQVACTDPNCTYGDCTSPGRTSSTLPPGSSPRVSAPITSFPFTSPVIPATSSSIAAAMAVCPTGYTRSTTGVCTPSLWTQMQPYVPLLLIAGIAAIALGGGGRK